MTRKELRTKRRVRRQYRRINNAKTELEIIRVFCEHKEVERVNYEVKAGQIIEGQVVCSICGEVIIDEPVVVYHLK